MSPRKDPPVHVQGATCDATNRTGCAQTPTAVPLGTGGAAGVAVDQATDTAYVAIITAFNTDTPGTVAVIDGATCNGTMHTGCAAPIASMAVGVDPQQVNVDPATDTVYTANEQDNDFPGTVSILNGATCNGAAQNGCNQAAGTAPVGFGPLNVWIDQDHNQIWVDNADDTSVSIIDGAVCNAHHEAACARQWPKRSVVDYPNSVAFADNVNTAYVGSLWKGISVVPLVGQTGARSTQR